MTFAFPRTEKRDLNETQQEFTFKGQWSSGKVVDYHPNGMTLLKNPCYQTSMNIDHGASGGPVLKGKYVVGVNSTGMKVEEGSDPISFITPIGLIEDIGVRSNIGNISVKQLIENGVIACER